MDVSIRKQIIDKNCLRIFVRCDILPSLTVLENKKRCSPDKYWGTAFFARFMIYSILFPSFTFFLDSFHLPLGNKFVVCPKFTNPMNVIRKSIPFI